MDVTLAGTVHAALPAAEKSVLRWTVSEADAWKSPDAAVMAALPLLTLVARPSDPTALLMIATAGASDAQVTRLVMSCVLPSL